MLRRTRSTPPTSARSPLLASILILLAAVSAPAQESPVDEPGQWMLGGSIGFPGAEADFAGAFFTVGFHGTFVGSQRLSPDFAVGTMPIALAAGIAGVGARGGLALPIQVGARFHVLPSAGVSMMGLIGSGPPGGTVGVNAGLAVASVTTGSLGLRVGATSHWFRAFDHPIWLVELGLIRLR